MKVVDKNIYDEAVDQAKKVSLICTCVDFIFLDQWRRFREEDKWRLTYLGNAIGSCNSQCMDCLVYWNSGGIDDHADKSKLVMTLVLATESDLKNYSGSQRYLNCKSLEQYIASFVTCFVETCHDYKSMFDELDYVVGFKVVYSRDGNDLYILEMEIKERIIRECLSRYSREKRMIFAEAVLEIGLPAHFVK